MTDLLSGKIVAFPDPEDSMDALELFEAGREAEEQNGDKNEALRLYGKALARDRNMAGAHVNLGAIHLSFNKFDLAMGHFREAIRIDPHYSIAHFNLGRCLEMQGKNSEAMESYRMCLRLNPRRTDAHYNLAGLCERLGSNREAIAHYEFFLRNSSPSDPLWEPAQSELALLQAKDIHVAPPRWVPKGITPRSRSARRRLARERAS